MKAVRLKWGEPGSRVKRVVDSTVRSGRKARKVVVSVYPNGVVGYRLLGERSEYFRSAAGDYCDAVLQTKLAEKAKRKAERKARRGSFT